MRVLAKLMGINIKNDSLYAQEFETLRQAINSDAQLTIQFEDETTTEAEQAVTQQEETADETAEEVVPTSTNSNVYQNLAETSEEDDDEYSSTTEEYEDVASVADYIQSYSPEDRAEIAREINNGEISIKCK